MKNLVDFFSPIKNCGCTLNLKIKANLNVVKKYTPLIQWSAAFYKTLVNFLEKVARGPHLLKKSFVDCSYFQIFVVINIKLLLETKNVKK